MAGIVVPELIVDRSRRETTFLMGIAKHGYADANFSNPSDGILDFDHLSTDPRYPRQGIATALLTSTIMGATTLDDGNIERVRFSIINPVIVPLLRKVFDDKVKMYATEDDINSGSNEIDFMEARILTAIRQEQFDIYEASNEPIPPDFDAGVHAMAQLDPAVVATWVMPEIEFVD